MLKIAGAICCSALGRLRGEIAGNETDVLFGVAPGNLVHHGCGPGTTLELGKGLPELLRRHTRKWFHVAARLAIGAVAAGTRGGQVSREMYVLGERCKGR